MIDFGALHSECIHAVKMALECLLWAAFLIFCIKIAPYWIRR